MDLSQLNKSFEPITDQPLSCLETDKSALRAIAQAAVNVELFTIPLYMNALYSIHGTHQINAKDVTYYKGRQWPGAATTVNPKTANEKAFNLIFSVFIQEMLHLQMAANLVSAIGLHPCFTSKMLQNKDHGWTCYGSTITVIPHIVNLQDTQNDKDVRVNLEALNNNQVKLFCAIEQNEVDARKNIEPDKLKDYFPTVPFKGWTPEKTEADLPMFGTIGWLYECYAQYISIEYVDGKTLWEKVFDSNSVQQDMFNYEQAKSHPYLEFPRFSTHFTETDAESSFDKAIDMMSAITDQGEGSAIDICRYRKRQLNEMVDSEIVQEKYRPDKCALEGDYPSYNQHGKPAASADTEARYPNSKFDHYERFEEVGALLSKVLTWENWHQQGNSWSEKDLTNSEYKAKTAPKNIPAPSEVAGALNRLKGQETTMYPILSKVSVGAIAGITTVLDTYWQQQDAEFPYPSMVGSGDRISICWAIFGKAPDLSVGIGSPQEDKLYHACQGLNLEPEENADNCAAIEIYHTCRGSNACKAQGGCGFAQLDSGGGSCSALRVQAPTVEKGGQVLCGGPSCGGPSQPYSAPSDNKCRTFGGCAVPMSASQLYPNQQSGEMLLYDFEGPTHSSVPIGKMSFKYADSVYDKAWEAYEKVMKHRGKDVGDKPIPTDLRIALPPST
ncbi:ferritin-like domain-containing protein [Spartinivicinus ruber]|uniref:ferritin-like domain-containing protein n=1 Tax=Spartinivicinus ruber TaxID=2683272 RepID=UPI0013D65871|nr:ferritin-like domain-containing protein [Spartinivicinus ruber]